MLHASPNANRLRELAMCKSHETNKTSFKKETVSFGLFWGRFWDVVLLSVINLSVHLFGLWEEIRVSGEPTQTWREHGEPSAWLHLPAVLSINLPCCHSPSYWCLFSWDLAVNVHHRCHWADSCWSECRYSRAVIFLCSNKFIHSRFIICVDAERDYVWCWGLDFITPCKHVSKTVTLERSSDR